MSASELVYGLVYSAHSRPAFPQSGAGVDAAVFLTVPKVVVLVAVSADVSLVRLVVVVLGAIETCDGVPMILVAIEFPVVIEVNP